MPEPLSVLIVGLGSIGRRHLRNLRRVAPECHITVWRRRQAPSDAADGPEADAFAYDADAALGQKPVLALVTGPASTHIATATMLAEHDIHLFVEKPLATTLDGTDELISLCRRRSLVLQVGYNFRFYEPLRRMRQGIVEGSIGRVLTIQAEVGRYLPDWRPTSDYRTGVTASTRLGGGVVFELSHEIDYVRWLAGEVRDVSARVARVSDLEIDVEDVADISLGFTNGTVGTIHLDMIQRAPVRTCRVTGSMGTLLWNGLTHEVTRYSADTGTWTGVTDGPYDYDEMYIAQIQHCLQCIQGAATPAVDGETGRRVLEIALAAKQSAALGRVVTV